MGGRVVLADVVDLRRQTRTRTIHPTPVPVSAADTTMASETKPKKILNDRPLCAGCDGPIKDDNHLMAMGKTWHSDHFVCEECKETFPEGRFFPHEDKPYCRAHHLELFCSKCGVCKEAVENGLKFHEQTYHKDCFACRDCSVNLADRSTVEIAEDGHLYCEEDFFKRFGPKCPVCSEVLEGKVVQALDKSYHQKCFVCNSCKEELSKFVEDKKENPGDVYCPDCFADKFSPKHPCSACGEDINHKDQMKAFDLYWHKDCLKCSLCKRAFGADESMFNINSHLFCEEHYRHTLARCGRCVEVITGKMLLVGDEKFHPECLICEICECELNVERLWKRQIEGDIALVCEDHSKGPLTTEVQKAVAEARDSRNEKKQQAAKDRAAALAAAGQAVEEGESKGE